MGRHLPRSLVVVKSWSEAGNGVCEPDVESILVFTNAEANMGGLHHSAALQETADYRSHSRYPTYTRQCYDIGWLGVWKRAFLGRAEEAIQGNHECKSHMSVEKGNSARYQVRVSMGKEPQIPDYGFVPVHYR